MYDRGDIRLLIGRLVTVRLLYAHIMGVYTIYALYYANYYCMFRHYALGCGYRLINRRRRPNDSGGVHDTQAPLPTRRLDRRALQQGAGVAAGSGAVIGCFPTIWAQNIKSIRLCHPPPLGPSPSLTILSVARWVKGYGCCHYNSSTSLTVFGSGARFGRASAARSRQPAVPAAVDGRFGNATSASIHHSTGIRPAAIQAAPAATATSLISRPGPGFR